jgi:glycosyltransferase involved in cell wall biosynthesis
MIKLSLLYLCSEVNLGSGWAVVGYHTLREAAKNGHKITVLTQRDAFNSPIENVTYHNILFRFGSKPKFVDILNLFKVFYFFTTKKFNIIHILIEPYLVYAFFIYRARILLTAHGTYSVSLFGKSRLSFFYRLALKKVDLVLANSRYTCRRFREATNFAKIQICDLGVDFDYFSKKTVALKKEPAFCLIGQIKERKGVLIAIKAIESLRLKHPQVKLLVIGQTGNSYSRTCMDYVRFAKLENNVQFLGQASDSELVQTYAKSICNVLPSINTKDGSFEGFGLIHLEANAMGIPSIGSLETGNECAIESDVNGFLVKQNDVVDLAEKMEMVLERLKIGTYANLTTTSFQHAKNRSWNRYFEKVEQAYFC